MPFIYSNLRRLRRLRGEVVFKPFFYGTKEDGQVVSYDCHGTGRQDRGLVGHKIFRKLRPYGTKTGGSPFLIAKEVKRVRNV